MGVIGHTGRGNYGHGLDTVWQKLPDTEIEAVADAHVKAWPTHANAYKYRKASPITARCCAR